jgi:DNA repair protein RecO (recombination protein O)
MRVDWQPALVLHKRAYRETSLQLDLLTQDHGLISLIAKGVTGPKKHILRSQLQPLQHLKICYQQKSELGFLNQSELLSDSVILNGERLMAGLYLNELVLKLCPRHDADPELYSLLLASRNDLSLAVDLAWLVRRFERDLIAHLGYMTPWSFLAKDVSIEKDDYYRIHPEIGILNSTSEEPSALIGQDIIDFNEDRQPSKASMPKWRSVLHNVISQHIGNSIPRSWQMITDLSRKPTK